MILKTSIFPKTFLLISPWAKIHSCYKSNFQVPSPDLICFKSNLPILLPAKTCLFRMFGGKKIIPNGKDQTWYKMNFFLACLVGMKENKTHDFKLKFLSYSAHFHVNQTLGKWKNKNKKQISWFSYFSFLWIEHTSAIHNIKVINISPNINFIYQIPKKTPPFYFISQPCPTNHTANHGIDS